MRFFYEESYGRGGGLGRGRGLGVTRVAGVGVPVVVGVDDGVTDGSDGVGVAVGVGVGVKPGCAQYLPPVFRSLLASYPPQMIIWLPVQTAV